MLNKYLKGQQIIEYLLVLVVTITVIILALSRTGWFTVGVDRSICESTTVFGQMAHCAQYDEYGNKMPEICGNKCCEDGEEASCPLDCGLAALCPQGSCGLTQICEQGVDCGGCANPFDSCGGGGIAGVCGCTPTDCATLGACGPQPDGCGNTLDCGTCCGNGTCGDAAPTDPPENCTSCAADCGCTAPETCGGGGIGGICGCTAIACGPDECGPGIPNGCGGFMNCGDPCTPRGANWTCGGGGTCVCNPTTPAGGCTFLGVPLCGSGYDDGCGGTYDCDPACPGFDTCWNNSPAFGLDLCCNYTNPACGPGDCGSVDRGCGEEMPCTDCCGNTPTTAGGIDWDFTPGSACDPWAGECALVAGGVCGGTECDATTIDPACQLAWIFSGGAFPFYMCCNVSNPFRHENNNPAFPCVVRCADCGACN